MTDAGVFAKGKLDRGTRLLIEAVDVPERSLVLDLGCGYGPIGIAAAVLCPTCRVCMTDVNERACELARRNAALNGAVNTEVICGAGFSPVKGMKFDLILSNPPIRAGKRVLFEIIEGAATHLNPGGRLVVVAQTKQGAKSLLRMLAEVFPVAREVDKGGGYRVMEGVAEV
ncbi:MAG: class I SAM-dependent methyltransferase [Betaproteobacteria bacterium]